jgi:hypothetical protein
VGIRITVGTTYSNIQISGNIIYNFAYAGIYGMTATGYGSGFSITANTISSCGTNGIKLWNISYSVISLNTITSLLHTGVYTSGIELNYCYYNSIIGNVIGDTTLQIPAYGVWENNDANYNIYVGNIFKTGSGIGRIGADDIIVGNIGQTDYP